MKKSLEQPNIGDSTENSKVIDLDAIVSELRKKDFETVNFNRPEKSDPSVNRDAILAETRKKDFKTINFNSPEELDRSINYEEISYLELFTIVEKAVEGKYIPKDLGALYNLPSDNRLRLAIIENLPNFSGTKSSNEAQKILKDAALGALPSSDNYSLDGSNKQDRLYINCYRTDSEEYPEYDILATAAIENLAKFGKEAEETLCRLFIEARKQREEEYEVMVEDLKAKGQYSHGDYDSSNDRAEYFEDADNDVRDKEVKDLVEDGYYYNSKILRKISEVGSDKSIDFAIDFIKRDSSSTYIYKDELVEIFNKVNIEYSAGELLKLLRNEDKEISRRANNCLLRLELGRIGISEKGVKYLEKMYDLGELNNPDYFAQRLTAKGDIGVFDDEQVLQKYFNLGDLISDEKVVTPQVQDFVYETLFRTKEGETPEERREREKYLKEFKENYFDFYDDKFFEQTGIRFNNLDFKEQGWFLLCYKNADEAKREKLINFARKFREQGLVSFLSLEYNDSNGDKILEINEKLDRKEVEKILSRYIGIQANAQKLEETMKNSEFLDNKEMADDIKKKLRENIYDAIMSRATDILSTAYVIAQTGEAKADFYTGKEIKVTGINEVIEAMDVYEDFLEKMKGFFAEEGRYQFEHASSTEHGELSVHDFSIVNKETGEKSYCAISLRGDGTNEHLKDFEYDGEARINFLFNNKPISLNIQNKSRKEAITFRLDRECLTFNESGQNVIDKDNTRQDGRLSFDFGSIYEDSGRQNSVLGRVMSVGNYYTSQEKKKKPEYYHNKESFYYDLGKADIFKQIADTVEEFIESKYAKKSGAERLEQAA